MPTYTQYMSGDANTGRGASPSLWADCPTLEVIHDPSRGHHFFDDFIGLSALTTATFQGPYYSLQDAGVTIAPLANQDMGVIEVAGNDADNDEGHLIYGFEGGWARFGPGDKVWWEARIKKASVANEALGFFVGFTEPENIAVGTTLVADTAAPDASEDFVGFSCLCADGDVLETYVHEGGQTRLATVDAATIVADTYIKCGLKFNGQYGQCQWYINGVVVQTLTGINGLNWPDTNHLAMGMFTQVGAAVESKFEMDWWRGCAIGSQDD